MNPLNLSEGYDILESVQHDLDRLRGMSAENIKGAYVANILASLLLLKVKDAQTRRILKDTTGHNLRSHKQNMSPLNLWGFIVDKPDNAKLKGIIDSAAIRSLKTAKGRILKPTIKAVHGPISKRPHQLAWGEVIEAARVMVMRLDYRSVKNDHILDTLAQWKDASTSDKAKAFQDGFYQLQRFDSHSILLPRFRQAHTDILANKENGTEKDTEHDKLVKNSVKAKRAYKKSHTKTSNKVYDMLTVQNSLSEGDERADDEIDDVKDTNDETAADAIDAFSKRVLRGKLVVIRKRKFQPKTICNKMKKKHANVE